MVHPLWLEYFQFSAGMIVNPNLDPKLKKTQSEKRGLMDGITSLINKPKMDFSNFGPYQNIFDFVFRFE